MARGASTQSRTPEVVSCDTIGITNRTFKATEGPSWGYPVHILGAVCPFLEPFCELDGSWTAERGTASYMFLPFLAFNFLVLPFGTVLRHGGCGYLGSKGT